ncbi:phage tail tape measure protein [Streptomyces sp. NPDC059070]|uniref:phage tail tape measure protein n=1 Tax=Streptomyces sp. NPDC059070 TaxID=3346713 RepID=UPI0036A3C2FD
MVGELAATVTVDGAGATAGMNRARAAVQSGGDQIAATADRAGQQAGDELGAGVADGAARGGDHAARSLSGALKGIAGAVIGAGIGAALMAGVGQAMERAKLPGTFEAQLGATGPVAARYGKAAGDLYAGAIVDSVETGVEVIKGMARNGLLPPEATSGQVKTLGRQVADAAAVMGEDVSKVSRSVGTMLKNGLAKNAAEALDVLVKGSQNGVDVAEDLLDTFSEYPTEFRQLGLDAQTSMGLLQQGLKGGARDADIVADSLKEFTLQAQGMSEATATAYKELGFSSSQIQTTFRKGGPETAKAFEQILTKLRGVKDPAKKAEIAIGLFGTKFEDAQQAIYALDPEHAVQALGEVKGATDKAGDAMRDNASVKVEQFKRALDTKVVSFIGNRAIPVIETLADWVGAGGLGKAYRSSVGFIREHRVELAVAAGVVTTLLLPTLIALGLRAATTTTAVVTGWVTQSAAAATSAARTLAANAVIVAGWIATGVQATIQGARIAAAWVAAMGPVGWVIATIGLVVAVVAANWDTVKSATGAAWDWVSGKIKSVAQFLLDFFSAWPIVGSVIRHWDSIQSGTVSVWNSTIGWIKTVPGRITAFFVNWALAAIMVGHWQSAKDGTVRKASEMLAWVRELPKRIVSSLGEFGSLLYSKGQDLIRGLWAGIKSMGGWLKSTLMGWAKNMIPGPIAKALGIHSPSRVMRDRIGRHIPTGVIEGIKSRAGALYRTMRDLVTVPAVPTVPVARAALAPQTTLAGAVNSAGSGGGWSGPAVHIEHWHGGDQSPDQTAQALAWHAKARG